MMKCKETITILQAYVDGDLPPEARERVYAHLQACPECRAEAESYARLEKLLRNQPLERPPEDLVPGVVANVRAARALSIRRTLVRITAIAASILLAALLAYRALTLLHPEKSSSPLTTASVAAPDIGVALAGLWNLLSDSWTAMPDYSDDIAGGLDWLAAPFTNYLNEMLPQETSKVERATFG